jgi:hypothetical protein
MQTLQADYFAAYRHVKLSRDDKGVLVAEFHSDGGPFIMNAQAHTEFVVPEVGYGLSLEGASSADPVKSKQPKSSSGTSRVPETPGYAETRRL